MTTWPDTFELTAVPRAKAEGAFIALAAGDALGWPQEAGARRRGRQRHQARADFREWERSRGSRYHAQTEVIRAGEYSDDTQLTLAIARCRIHAGSHWWSLFTRNELPLWTIYERGGGGATKRAAESWLKGVTPWRQLDPSKIRKYFDAGGNGVAMRVLPHAVYYATDTEPTNLLRDVALDGVATHGHPRALVGAAAYAYAAWWLLRSQRTVGFGELVSALLENSKTWGAFPAQPATNNGWGEAAQDVVGDYESAWHQVVDEMAALLVRASEGVAAGTLGDDNEVLGGLGAFGSTKGAGTVSAAAAVYLTARYAAQPVQGVLRAAFATGADTDTIAAMTGGLLGSLAGAEWLPREWFSVQDSDYLRRVANKLAAHVTPPAGTAPPIVSANDLGRLTEAVLAGSTEDLDFGGMRRVRIIDASTSGPSSRATKFYAWTLKASDGQTIHLTELSRKSKGELVTGRYRETALRPTSTAAEKRDGARAVSVTLSVANLAASADFYEVVLGLFAMRKTPRLVSFGSLSLVDQRHAFDSFRGAVAPGPSAGRNRIEIHVRDLDRVYDRLVQQKVSIPQSITLLPWGERSLTCLDPDGNIVELIERRK
jgi:ADP-ribosylglycohydrolase/catechol 2,3-dioxygenase-like lactoylglutathione lyase family enzyme